MIARPKFRTGIGRRAVLAGPATLLASPSIVRAQGANGVALVIGNSKYHWEAQLPNVKRDAPDVARAFQAKGLKTELLQDVSRETLQQAVSRFKASSSGATLAALYYAGHGASWGNDTYLVPVDADLGTPDAVKTLLPIRDVTAAMKGAANRLLVFDNCRNNPADGWRQLASERDAVGRQDEAQADDDPNSLTIYSTAPGRVALDGPPGQNSPFAAAFLNQLGAASVDFATLPARLTRALLIVTQGRQVVWDHSTYAAPFALGGGKPGPVGGNSVAPGGDPARMIELPNAYAFARQNGFALPDGLIAYRAGTGTDNAYKAGSYEATVQTKAGSSPYLLIVLSADTQTAELITVIQNDRGRVWRFITGQISGNRLTYVPNQGRPEYVWDWSDAHSGSIAQVQKDAVRGSIRGTRFKRLDG